MARNMSQVNQKYTEAELTQQVNNLKSQLNFQADANQRLSKELNLCLQKLGINRVEVLQSEPLKHHTDLSFLAPLFLIYDDHVQKLEQIMGNLMDDLKDMETRINLVTEDNTYLRKQLEGKNEEMLKLFRSGPQDGVQSVFAKLELASLEERIRLLNEENSIYISRIKQHESNIIELQNRQESFSQNEKQLVNQIHDYQQDKQRLEITLDEQAGRILVLDNRLKEQLQQTVIAEEEKTEYAQRVNKSDNEIKVLRHQIASIKQTLESQVSHGNQQKQELLKELEELKNKEREAFDRQIYLEREVDQLRDENRGLRKAVDQERGNVEASIQMMESFENRIMVLQKKEENLKTVNMALKEEKEKIILERDTYSLKEQQFEQTLQLQISKGREELQIFKDQTDRNNEATRNRYRTIIEQREEEIQRLNQELTQSQILQERLTRENKSLKSEIARLEGSLKQDIEVNYQQADDLHRQVSEMQERNTIQLQQIHDLEQQLTTQGQQHESQMRVIQNSSADLRQALEHTRSQLTSASQELSTMKGKTNQLTRANQNLIEELAKTKKHYEQRLELIQDEYTHKIKNIQIQNEEALKREKQSRERSVQLLQQYDMIEEKLRTEYNNRIIELETANQGLKNQNKTLSLKLHEIKNAGAEHTTMRRN